MKKNLLLSMAAALVCGTAMAGPAMPVKLQQHNATNVHATAQLAGKGAQSTLVKSVEVTSGVNVETRRSVDGTMFKQLVRHGKAYVPNKVKSLAAEPSIYESWEDWDGTDSKWLPTGWTRTVSDTALWDNNGGATWHVAVGGGFDPAAAEGSNVMLCNMAYPAVDQDEWVVTPQFTVQEGEKLFFTVGMTPIFLFDLYTGVDWETMEWTNNACTATVKALIREGDGEWVELHDVYNDFKDKSFTEMWDNYFSMDNFAYAIDLSAYVGKTVTVGFEYVGFDGNTMGIDAIKVGIPTPAASYARPQGTFYWGFTPKYELLTMYNQGMMLAPACVPLTWTNTSNAESESFEWSYITYSNLGLPQYNTSTDVDLTLDYPVDYSAAADFWQLPSLTARAAHATDSTYTAPSIAMKVGGRPEYTFDGATEATQFTAGNYDVPTDGFFALTSGDSNYLMGYHNGIDNTWTSIMGSPYNFHGVADYFEQPLRPYAITTANVHGVGSFKSGSTSPFKLCIIEANELGQMTDTLAVATATVADVVSTQASGDVYYHTIPFVFTDEDGVPTTLVIDKPVWVTVEGFNSDNTEAFGVFQTGASAMADCYGYFLVESASGSIYSYPNSALSTASGALYSTFLIDMDVNYSWFETVDDDSVVILFEADPAGETRTYNVEASTGTSQWTQALDTPADWLTVQLADTPAATDVRQGRGTVTLTCAPMPQGNGSREAVLTVGTGASTKVFHVTQKSSSSISTVGAAGKLVATVNGGQLTINSAATVYNMAGLRIATVNGATTIDAQAWPAGIYIVRTHDGRTARVIK